MEEFKLYFANGILYFFGLAPNPMDKIENHQKTDAENLSNDWRMVGSDIRKAYEACKESID